MKKFLIMLFLTALVANNMSCGSGGSSSNTPGKTMVTLTLGQQKAVAFSGPQPRGTASSIPSSVVEVIITISAPDMDTIQEIIPVSSGQTSLSVTIDVPNGLNRHFVIEGRDAAGNVLFRGETYADLNGSPITLSIPMIPTSTVAPVVFSGISSIGSITSTSLVLTWSPASGGISMPGNMQYLIYMSTTPGGENFAAPSFTTLPGATSFTVSGLNPGVTYYFVIRAQDEAGNKDTNTNEMSATTLIGSDVIHPVFGGVESAMPNSPTEITLTWPPASDNASAASRIVYLVYMSTTPGGENFAAPSFATLPGAASFTVSGLNPGVTYYFVIRAQDEAGNKDTNTIEKSATTLFIDLFPDNVTVTNFIRFDVDNSGNMAANNVQVYIQDSDGYSIYCNFYTVTVPPGGSVHLSHYAGYTPMTYTIRIDPRNLISETDETNNVSCRRSFCTTPPSLSSCSAAAP